MKKYRRLDWNDRLLIEKLYNCGRSCSQIAHILCFAPSSIYREVKHGLYPHLGAETTRRPFHYSAQIAQDYADFQATSKGKQIKLGNNYGFAADVAQQIKQGCSIDVIVTQRKKSGAWTVSTSTLYRYVDLGFIPGVTNKHLPEKIRRKKRSHNIIKATRPPKGTPIDRRSEEIDRRLSFGHWEMDSVIGTAKGKRQSLLVLTERLTRFGIIVRVSGKTSSATVRALDKILPKFPQGTFKSITVDNGSEFQDSHGMEYDRNGCRRTIVYYCHPYSSWERGSNERNNRIIRRYFPKGKSMAKVTQKDCDNAAALINAMPRKILNYSTAAELFEREIVKLTNSTL
ncbi:MAG: IS30 family transposase [Clostridiales bacterium]|nr:IS30 family transposase [Clostridiales bacterium]